MVRLVSEFHHFHIMCLSLDRARETDLGIGTWNFNEFSEPEIIKPHRLCGHFALAEIPLPNKRRAWATVSLDHVSTPKTTCSSLNFHPPQLTQEPEDFDFDGETT